MTFGLVNASFSLPEWQAVEMTFFARCVYNGYLLPTSTDELSSFYFLFKIHMYISSAVFNFLGQKKGKLNPRGAQKKSKLLRQF